MVKPTHPKRDFPSHSSVRTLPSNARDVGSIPGQGTKIPHAMRPKYKTSNAVTKPHPSGPLPTGKRRAQTPAGHSGNSSAQGADHITHRLVQGTYSPILDLPVIKMFSIVWENNILFLHFCPAVQQLLLLRIVVLILRSLTPSPT